MVKLEANPDQAAIDAAAEVNAIAPAAPDVAPPPARVVGGTLAILTDLKDWLENVLQSATVHDLAGVNSTASTVLSVGEMIVHMLDPNSGKEAEREADLINAFSRGDKAYLTTWLDDQPPHPNHSNDLARWYLSRLPQ